MTDSPLAQDLEALSDADRTPTIVAVTVETELRVHESVTGEELAGLVLDAIADADNLSVEFACTTTRTQ